MPFLSRKLPTEPITLPFSLLTKDGVGKLEKSTGAIEFKKAEDL